MAGAPDEARLWELCEAFIRDHGIHCEDKIWQDDAIAVDVLELLEKICGIVGYDK